MCLPSNLRRPTLFLMAGGLSFLVNLVGLLALKDSLGPLVAQAAAFALATVVSWAMNALLTFRDRTRATGLRLRRYFIASGFNAIVINLLYLGGIKVGVSAVPSLIVAGALAALLSFIVLDRWVFHASGRWPVRRIASKEF